MYVCVVLAPVPHWALMQRSSPLLAYLNKPTEGVTVTVIVTSTVTPTVTVVVTLTLNPTVTAIVTSTVTPTVTVVVTWTVTPIVTYRKASRADSTRSVWFLCF